MDKKNVVRKMILFIKKNIDSRNKKMFSKLKLSQKLEKK